MQKYLNKITLSINSNVNFSRYYLYYYLLNHIDKRIFVVGNLSFFCLCDNRQYILYIFTILKFALIQILVIDRNTDNIQHFQIENY